MKLKDVIKKIIPDSLYLKYYYWRKSKKKLNLREPKTFNEKLQWLKLYNRKPEYTNMVDKYVVREYIKEKIGEEYLIPLLGVYDKFEDIEFNKLPKQFVIKCNHDSGGLVICKDKNNFNIMCAKTKINECLKRNYYYAGREWPYKNVKPRIIVEEYMEDEKSVDLRDYKFFCFNGEPKYLYVSEGLVDHSTAKISFYDMNYNEAEFGRTDYEKFSKKPEKPINFEKMKELTKILSKDIPFIRVDFYEINKKIYFGELTFYPTSGMMPFDPPEYDKILGDMLILPEKRRKNEK